jgi:hypothetical protein
VVERELLAGYGSIPMFRTITETVDDGERADIEAALVNTTRKMTEPSADIMALAAHVQLLQARRDALPVTAPTIRRQVPTGSTVGQAYIAADTTAAHRELVATFVPCVLVGPGVRGRHGFDETRVQLVTLDARVDDHGHVTLSAHGLDGLSIERTIEVA